MILATIVPRIFYYPTKDQSRLLAEYEYDIPLPPLQDPPECWLPSAVHGCVSIFLQWLRMIYLTHIR